MEGLDVTNNGIRIIDPSGATLKSYRNIDTSSRLDVSELIPGMYMLEVENGRNKFYKKLVIN